MKLGSVIFFFASSISLLLRFSTADSDYSAGVRGGCPNVYAFFNVAPMSPCYGTRCARAQCQADCDRTSACVGYEFDSYEQSIDQSGYCFMLSKNCPVPLNKIGEDYRTRWTYMKLRLSFKDDIPITYRSMNENRVHQQQASATGPVMPIHSPVYRPQRWRSASRRVSADKLLYINKPSSVTTRRPPTSTTPKVLELPDFVSLHGGCPSANSFLAMAPNFICQGRRCHKVDCATACLSSSLCIGFEFDAWDQSSLSSSGYCWLLKSTCSAKLVVTGEDFASRWTYLRRWDESTNGPVDVSSMVISIGAAATSPVIAPNQHQQLHYARMTSSSASGILIANKNNKPQQHQHQQEPAQIHPVENNFYKMKQASEGKFLKVHDEPAIDMNVSNQPLVPKMHFVHGWNLQQPYMMSIGGCTSSPGGGSLVYLAMELPPPSDGMKSAEKTTTPLSSTTSSGALSVRQCLYHQCTRFDCENTCNLRPECVGYEFAGVSHGLTTVGYCHLLKRPCPADQRSDGAVFLTRLTYLKAE